MAVHQECVIHFVIDCILYHGWVWGRVAIKMGDNLYLVADG